LADVAIEQKLESIHCVIGAAQWCMVHAAGMVTGAKEAASKRNVSQRSDSRMDITLACGLICKQLGSCKMHNSCPGSNSLLLATGVR
jgi:hypothetical protein